MQIQFSGKLTEADLGDVRRIVRSKWYWPKLVVANWYGLTLLCIAVWGTVAGLLGSLHPNWQAIGLIWVVIFAIFGWVFYRTKKAMAKEFVQLNTTLPDSVNLGDEGITLSGPNGASAFQPWRNFKALRQGQRVILLDMRAGGFVILPVFELPENERQSICHLYLSHISVTEAF